MHRKRAPPIIGIMAPLALTHSLTLKAPNSILAALNFYIYLCIIYIESNAARRGPANRTSAAEHENFSS